MISRRESGPSHGLEQACENPCSILNVRWLRRFSNGSSKPCLGGGTKFFLPMFISCFPKLL